MLKKIIPTKGSEPDDNNKGQPNPKYIFLVATKKKKIFIVKMDNGRNGQEIKLSTQLEETKQFIYVFIYLGLQN